MIWTIEERIPRSVADRLRERVGADQEDDALGQAIGDMVALMGALEAEQNTDQQGGNNE